MSDANSAGEAGAGAEAGAEALLGLAAQAGQAVRLPALPSITKRTPATHTPFLPSPPSLALPTQPQPLQPQSLSQSQPQQSLQQTLPPQPSTAPLQPSAPSLPPPLSVSVERLPTLSEWADPTFRPFPPPLLAPLPDRWQTSAPVPPPPSQYPYHNPWQSYPYPPPYYYYQQQNMSYPLTHQPSVTPVPPPLALPNQPVVPPLRVPVHTDPVRDAAATNESSAFPPIPQPRAASNRDPLLERLTSEAAAVPKKTPSRARGLADLMNPTDTIPGASEGLGQSRMEVAIIKPETIESKVTPVTVPRVPSAEPKLSDVVNEHPQSRKLDLVVIAGVSTENVHKTPSPQNSETIVGEDRRAEEVRNEKRTSEEKRWLGVVSPVHEEPEDKKENKKSDQRDVSAVRSEEEKKIQKPESDSVRKEDEDMPDRNDDSGSDPDLQDGGGDDEDKGNDDADNGDEETRCPCGSTANSGAMIACDQCNTWQHWRCMGFRRSSEVPEEYYCHICRPDEIRPTCIAHPKYKDRSNRERNSQDRRDFESQLSLLKPIEVRRLFVSDMRHKKTLMRSKADVFLRYAGLLKNQYGKHRQSIVDGLAILLDMQGQDVAERLEAVMRRLKVERPDEIERKRSGMTTSNEGPLSELGNSRTPGSIRGQTQKRARPHSIAMDGSEMNGALRGESSEALGDFDLGADALHGRNMSREERKLQQTMKLFARMEEREREKKKPRTGDVGASPKAGPPSRSRTPKPASARNLSPKSSVMAITTEESGGRNAGESQRKMEEPDAPEQKSGPLSETQVTEVSRPDQTQEEASQPNIVQPVPQQKSALTSRSENEMGKKDREQRRDRVERTAPRRKESCSPDNVNGTGNGRRRSILARERSQEGKRRRMGLSKESERRGGAPKELHKRDPSLEFAVVLPGPSVIGSKKIMKTRLSKIDREIREKEEMYVTHEHDQALPNGNKKERLLEDARKEAMKKHLNGGKSPSPMKKRYRLGGEVRVDESDEEENGKEPEHVIQQFAANGKAPETLCVSMVVVSEKGSLPDRGQILESTRLILPGANGKKEDEPAKREDTARTVCLKKRPAMFALEANKDESDNIKLSPTTGPQEKSTDNQSLSSKPSSPSSPRPQKSPASPMRVASPKLRSCPAPVLRSPTLRSVPADDVRQPIRSPSPLPSFKSQKLPPLVQKPQSESPEAEKKAEDQVTESPKESQKPRVVAAASLAQSTDGKAWSSLDSSAAGDRHDERSKNTGDFRTNMLFSKTSPDTKHAQSSAAPPPLRSIRSIPPPVPKKDELSVEKAQNSGREAHKDGTAAQPSLAKHASGSATISDIFQQRVQGFLRPSAGSPSPSPRGLGPKYGLGSPLPSPRAGGSHLTSGSPVPSVRGSTAKLGAALPLSSKPNLDGLRNSNGLSPRVTGSGHVYSRNYGPGYRGKPVDVDRSWNSVPSFSSLKRQHGFDRGSRGGSLIGGRSGSFSGVERGRHSHGRDGMSSYGRDDILDKTRSGYRRDGHYSGGREDDKVQGGNQSSHGWSRSYAHRNGWRGSGMGHHSSGDGSGRGSRRGHHGS